MITTITNATKFPSQNVLDYTDMLKNSCTPRCFSIVNIH